MCSFVAASTGSADAAGAADGRLRTDAESACSVLVGDAGVTVPPGLGGTVTPASPTSTEQADSASVRSRPSAAPAASADPVLAATKLHIPALRPGHVHRGELV